MANTTFKERVLASNELWWRIVLLLAVIGGGIAVEIALRDHNGTCSTIGNVTTCSCSEGAGEWSQLYWYSAALILTAQLSTTVKQFYLGEGKSFWGETRHFLLGSDDASGTSSMRVSATWAAACAEDPPWSATELEAARPSC